MTQRLPEIQQRCHEQTHDYSESWFRLNSAKQ